MTSRLLLIAVLICLAGLTSDILRKPGICKSEVSRRTGNTRVVLIMDANTLLQVGRSTITVQHGPESRAVFRERNRVESPRLPCLSARIRDERRLLASGETLAIFARVSLHKMVSNDSLRKIDENN
jgi:hypothetical protein